MKNLFIIVFISLAMVSCLLEAIPIERRIDNNGNADNQAHVRVRRQWGMPMGGFGGFPMMGGFGGGPFGMPMGGFGGGMPFAGRRSRSNSMRFTSIQLPFINIMSGAMDGRSSMGFIG